MGFAYHAADLIIGRAGATTISELTALGLPAILIPYPYAQAHQKENAKLLEEHNAAVLIEDGELSIETLKLKIVELIKIKERLNTLAVNSKRLGNPYASNSLAKEIITFCLEFRSKQKGG
jgi:UDP-N-acetylglucosamine--N-acetylmuramyl-(pentapeptide) pyrophosphoryl-undecaprenol N-acetylglucosamine transferase